MPINTHCFEEKKRMHDLSVDPSAPPEVRNVAKFMLGIATLEAELVVRDYEKDKVNGFTDSVGSLYFGPLKT